MAHKLSNKSDFTYDLVNLDELTGESTIEVLREGKWDGMKGKFAITKSRLAGFVQSFKDKLYGSDLQVNFGHDRGGEAAGWIKDVFLEGKKLLARVEWTSKGLEAIKNKLFRYISAEIAFEYEDEETSNKYKNVLIGAALTNIPYVRGLAPIQLSESLSNLFTNSTNMNTFKIFLDSLLGKDVVTSAEKEVLKQMHTSLDEDEQSQVAEDVEKVEDKPEEPAEEAKGEEAEGEAEGETEESKAEGEEEKKEEGEEEKEEAAEEGEEKKEEELSEETDKSTLLAEVKRLREDNKEARSLADKTAAKLRLTEIKEEAKSLQLSETSGKRGKVAGVPKALNEKLVGFMAKLSDNLRSEFTELMGSVQTVDFSIYGSGESVEKSADLQDEICKLADKLLSEGTAKNIDEAQKMAAKQLK